MNSRLYRSLLLAAVSGLCGASLHAQVSYSEIGSTYTQDFNSQTVLPDGSVEWTNNQTYQGWTALYYNGTTTTYTVPATATVTIGDGTGLNLYRSSGSPDVALGGQATNGAAMNPYGSGGIYYGFAISNDTGSSLESFSFGYTGEQWRRAGNATAHQLVVSYSLNAASLDDANATWISVPEATFTGPRTTTTGTALSLDGNADANRAVIVGVTITGLQVDEGQTIWLRWFDVNDANADHGLAIDDVWFTATAVPEPSAYGAVAGCAGMLAAFLHRRKRRMKS